MSNTFFTRAFAARGALALLHRNSLLALRYRLLELGRAIFLEITTFLVHL